MSEAMTGPPGLDAGDVLPGLEPGDVDRVSRTAALLFVEKTRFAALFYDRLFDAQPDLRRLFTGDAGPQREMVMSAMAAILRGVTKPDTLLPTIERLAHRHRDLGVTPDQMRAASDALSFAARAILDEHLGDNSHAAWSRVFFGLTDALAQRMGVLGE